MRISMHTRDFFAVWMMIIRFRSFPFVIILFIFLDSSSFFLCWTRLLQNCRSFNMKLFASLFYLNAKLFCIHLFPVFPLRFLSLGTSFALFYALLSALAAYEPSNIIFSPHILCFIQMYFLVSSLHFAWLICRIDSFHLSYFSINLIRRFLRLHPRAYSLTRPPYMHWMCKQILSNHFFIYFNRLISFLYWFFRSFLLDINFCLLILPTTGHSFSLFLSLSLFPLLLIWLPFSS